ncbi:MAG: xanthine dehydrogenase family protein subunit M [Caldilineaceae bacterium]|nr:xanthine dehydrogenase family protein subunit M [Caldilineaceae bacterium]MCB0140715.1 xanthine dehydrogenase family protein subunit M [Caldilineaceae bacterium]MCB9156447.1 xanthine dehydrogenase family protein subunit M [Caldilineaceae bacterium]
MQAFDYVSANSIDEAVLALQKASGSARILAGGTDLLVALREGRLSAQTVVDIKHVPETTELSYSAENGLRLGAAVPCHRLYNDKEISTAYPGLMDSASLIGGVQIQGRASLGGNLCNASPAADSIPSLIAHSAVCTIAGPNGRRQVAVEDFCTAPGRTVLENGEFLVYMDIPAPKAKFGAAYLRFIPRNEMDIAVVGTGAAVQLSADGSKFEAARIALGAVAPRPLFVKEAGDALVGQPVNAESIAKAAAVAQAAATPISDMRGTAEYRKHLAGVITRRVLEKAVARAQAN